MNFLLRTNAGKDCDIREQQRQCVSSCVALQSNEIRGNPFFSSSKSCLLISGRTLWMEDQLVARAVPTELNENIKRNAHVA